MTIVATGWNAEPTYYSPDPSHPRHRVGTDLSARLPSTTPSTWSPAPGVGCGPMCPPVSRRQDHAPPSTGLTDAAKLNRYRTSVGFSQLRWLSAGPSGPRPRLFPLPNSFFHILQPGARPRNPPSTYPSPPNPVHRVYSSLQLRASVQLVCVCATARSSAFTTTSHAAFFQPAGVGVSVVARCLSAPGGSAACWSEQRDAP